ncbi:MAG: hypothetical protein R2690_12980 [Acidimicrobiales bacterium]
MRQRPDRNLLGFRRDLLTAAAYGVEEFLFVYGDRPETGRRSDDLTVRTMIDTARTFAEEQSLPIRIGVSCGLGPCRPGSTTPMSVPPGVLRPRHHAPVAIRRHVAGAVYAGVMALPSAGMARKISTDVPQLAMVVDRLEADPDAGVDLAVDLVTEVRATGAFERPPDPGQSLPPGRHAARTQAALSGTLAHRLPTEVPMPDASPATPARRSLADALDGTGWGPSTSSRCSGVGGRTRWPLAGRGPQRRPHRRRTVADDHRPSGGPTDGARDDRGDAGDDAPFGRYLVYVGYVPGPPFVERGCRCRRARC